MSEKIKKNTVSEYLLLIASRQKISLNKDIEFNEMKKLLFDIPVRNWTKKRISYTITK